MRKKGLDILRAIAVILVLFRHSDLENHILKDFGWLGVDLFFVLSGFLISSLLFKEYQKQETIDIKRFLIRRSFKIFPPFYFFLGTTLLVDYYWGIQHEGFKIITELCYLQSYAAPIWIHTWSLAVEEHFYISFAIIMFFLSNKKLLYHKSGFIKTVLFLLVLSFLMRLQTSYPHRHEAFYSFMKTHLRADGILMGVLLSYLYHFTHWTTYWLHRKKLSLLISAICIAPAFYFKAGSFFMNTIGLTITNLGFAFLVLLSLDIEKYLQRQTSLYSKWIIAGLCFIGINSYSIYLWHLNAKRIINLSFVTNTNLGLVLYILLSIALGVLMSYGIEKSSLKLRDRLFQ